MNYQNIDNEIKKFTEYFKSSQSTVSKLVIYYKEIGKIGGKFADKMKILLDYFFLEFSKDDRSTTFNKLLTNFYNEKKNFINQLKNYYTSLEKTYGEKLAIFEKDHINKNKENISKLSKLNTTLVESKNNVDKWKNQYFDMCKSIVETGKKIRNLEQNDKGTTGKEKDNTENLNKLKTQLTKYKDLKELKKKNYREEQIKLNKLLEAYETNYNNFKALIEKEYCNRIDFINKIILEINKSTTTFINEYSESIKKIDTFCTELNIKRDERSFKQDYNFYINKDNTKVYKRFILEEFLDYDFVLEKAEKPGSTKSLNTILSNDINKADDDDYEYYRARSIIRLGESKLVDFDYLNDKGKEINDIIKKLLNDENKIEDNELLDIINYIENNGENCNNFMEVLVTHFCQYEFIIIKNLDNFHNLINILIIILNYIFDKKEVFDVCFFVLFISEKAIYFSPEDTQINLSIFKIISKQRIFNSVNFWKDLINARIEMVAKIDIRKEFEKRRKNINNPSNKFFGKFFGGKKDENEIIENEILKKQIYNEKLTQYFTTVFYDFLKHFTNFNFLKVDELLDTCIEKYKLDEKTISFFKNVIQSNNLFIKEKKINNSAPKDNKKILFDYRAKKKFKNIDDITIKGILFSLKYIEKSQYPTIICLSKKYQKDILKIIYKNILYNNYKNIDIKTHLEIWRILLNYKDIKKEYDYNKIKESNKDPNKKIICADIIDLDIMRTFFSKNKEEKIQKIGHILKAIASELPKINYYQGMNQIAAFLLNICDDNEEEVFYIFMSFLKNSEYSNLYKDDLQKMNTIFYTFDRLLNLYLPEIYSFFKVSSINSGYYISPWFITLFTNAFIDVENKNNAKSIMMIWDMFIFSGWKEIMKIGIILLKQKERQIMERVSECLLPLLTSEILKSEIFDSEHYEQLIELCTSPQFRIANQLFEDIDKEYEIKKTVPFFINDTHINSF